MSRIGKRIITINENTKVEQERNILTIIGPKGTLKREFDKRFKIVYKDNTITVISPNKNDRQIKMLYGTINSHIFNMVQGVNTGFQKKLKIIGVGYRCRKDEDKLIFQLGFSHKIELVIPKNLKAEVLKQTSITINGFDKELVGSFAAAIRKLKTPEPYLGKGIRYEDEHVIRKEGKKAGK